MQKKPEKYLQMRKAWERRLQILRWADEGFSRKEIGRRLNIGTARVGDLIALQKELERELIEKPDRLPTLRKAIQFHGLARHREVCKFHDLSWQGG